MKPATETLEQLSLACQKHQILEFQVSAAKFEQLHRHFDNSTPITNSLGLHRLKYENSEIVWHKDLHQDELRALVRLA